MKNISTLLTFLFFLVLIVCARWIPHPPNFSPVLAIALFCGARFGLKSWVYALPVLGVFLSDCLLGFHDLSLVVYLCLVPMVWMGSKWNLNGKASSQIFSGLAMGFWASALFFFVTNFAVWATGSVPMNYPMTAEGLLICFVAALPFFHYSLLSTWIFQGVLALSAKAVEVFGRRTVSAR
jgi:hypothetical protein